MITRKEKEQRIKEIEQDLQQADFLVLTDYRGLNVDEISNLRRSLRENDCKYKVVKNNLAKIAASQVGKEEINNYLEGPVAIAYGYDDPVATAKALTKADKELKNLSITAGYLEGKILSPADIKALGEIPSKEVLYCKLCGAFQAPISGLVNVLQGNIRNLACAFDAIRRQKEAG